MPSIIHTLAATPSAPKFTPGPYSIETKGSKHFIDGDDGLTVAYLDRRGVRDEKTIEANARLIAQAPRLFAALQACADEIASLRRASGEAVSGPSAVESEARAALAAVNA